MAKDKDKRAEDDEPEPIAAEATEAGTEDATTPVPVRYTISLEGSADDADIEALQAAFADLVDAIRAIGLTIAGTLAAHEIDYRTPAGDLVTGRVVHDNAGDVGESGEAAQAKALDDAITTAAGKPHPKGPTPAEVEAGVMASHEASTKKG